jgi:hypothetical protein
MIRGMRTRSLGWSEWTAVPKRYVDLVVSRFESGLEVRSLRRIQELVCEPCQACVLLLRDRGGRGEALFEGKDRGSELVGDGEEGFGAEAMGAGGLQHVICAEADGLGGVVGAFGIPLGGEGAEVDEVDGHGGGGLGLGDGFATGVFANGFANKLRAVGV